MTGLELCLAVAAVVVHETVDELGTEASAVVASVVAVVEVVAKDAVGSLAAMVTVACAASTFGKTAASVGSEATTHLVQSLKPPLR